jgi:hypothetical protein
MAVGIWSSSDAAAKVTPKRRTSIVTVRMVLGTTCGLDTQFWIVSAIIIIIRFIQS